MHIVDLLQPQGISLNGQADSKSQVISQLADLMEKNHCLNDKKQYLEDVLLREQESSTGFGGGVAIPHAKSVGVNKPGLVAMVVKQGVDFEAIDGQKVYLLFMIASPLEASNEHIDVLAHLSRLLIDEDFRNGLIHCQDVAQFLEVISRAESALEPDEPASTQPVSQSEDDYYDLVAVTACPAGLSHTYMAAESLERKAKELGLRIKVEADGAAGNRNQLTPQDIAHAKGVIVAADRIIAIDRFIGKPLVRVGVMQGIRKPQELIKRALSEDCPRFEPGSSHIEHSSVGMRMYRHLMSGLTYIMPLAATAGILSALARLDLLRPTQLGVFFDTIGYSVGTLLLPVLSAFIAFSIAGRAALAAGFIGGVMADISNAGVLAAVVNGFVGGGVAYVTVCFAQRFLKGHDAMFALLVYPLVGALGTTTIAQFITNLPLGYIDNLVENFFIRRSHVGAIVVCTLLAAMMSADMGGPLNKIAYACGVLLLADSLPEIGPGSYVMAAVMAGGMVPPLAVGLATLVGRPFYSAPEKAKTLEVLWKGLLFITEAVIPYLKIAPTRMRLVSICASGLAGGLSSYYGCAVCAPHGGIFIIALSQNPLAYLQVIAIASVIGCIGFVAMRISVGNKE